MMVTGQATLLPASSVSQMIPTWGGHTVWQVHHRMDQESQPTKNKAVHHPNQRERGTHNRFHSATPQAHQARSDLLTFNSSLRQVHDAPPTHCIVAAQWPASKPREKCETPLLCVVESTRTEKNKVIFHQVHNPHLTVNRSDQSTTHSVANQRPSQTIGVPQISICPQAHSSAGQSPWRISLSPRSGSHNPQCRQEARCTVTNQPAIQTTGTRISGEFH